MAVQRQQRCDDKVSFGSRQGANESGSHKWTDLQLARKGEAMQGVVTHSATHGGGVVYIQGPAKVCFPGSVNNW